MQLAKDKVFPRFEKFGPFIDNSECPTDCTKHQFSTQNSWAQMSEVRWLEYDQVFADQSSWEQTKEISSGIGITF